MCDICRCMASLAYTTVARGDDIRNFHLCDILRFEKSEVLKPCPAYLLTLVQFEGKTYNVSILSDWKPSLISLFPLICAQFSCRRSGDTVSN